MEKQLAENLDHPVLDKSLDFKLSHEDLEGKSTIATRDELEQRSPTLFSISTNILKGAVPSMIQLFSAMFLNNTTLHFIGRKDDMTLFDAISLANNVLSCLSSYIIFHTNIGLNAASSQAYGAGRYKLVGLYLHRALIIHFIINTIMYVLLYNSLYFFNLMGINPTIGQVASSYLVLCPGFIFGIMVFDTVKNYLYAHESFNPPVVCQVVICTAYWFLLKYFLLDYNMKEKGVILALTISQLIGTILLLAYVHLRRPNGVKETWFFFEKESFQGLRQLFKIMVGVGAMGYVEVLAYKIQSFAAVYLSEPQMAAFVTFLSFDDLYYVLPVGVAISLTSFIGNAIGSRDKKRVSLIIKSAFLMGIGLLSMLITLFAVFRNQIFNFYTQNMDVKDILFHVGYVYYFFFVADFFQNLLAGILKGLGKERSGTKAFLLSVYLVALPFSLLLAFHFKLGAIGMWIGITIGVYIVVASYAWIFMKIDFQTQMNYISQRIKETQLF